MPTIRHIDHLIFKTLLYSSTLFTRYLYHPFLHLLPANLALLLDSLTIWLLYDLLLPSLFPLLCLYFVYRLIRLCLHEPESLVIRCIKASLRLMVAIVFFVALALMVVDVVGPLREMSYRLLLLAVVQAKGSDDNTLKKKDARESSKATPDRLTSFLTAYGPLQVILQSLPHDVTSVAKGTLTLLLQLPLSYIHHRLTHTFPTLVLFASTYYLSRLSHLLHQFILPSLLLPFLPILNITVYRTGWWFLPFHHGKLQKALSCYVLMSYIGIMVISGLYRKNWGVVKKPGWMRRWGVVGEGVYAFYVWHWVMAHGVVAGYSIWYVLEVSRGLVERVREVAEGLESVG